MSMGQIACERLCSRFCFPLGSERYNRYLNWNDVWVQPIRWVVVIFLRVKIMTSLVTFYSRPRPW